MPSIPLDSSTPGNMIAAPPPTVQVPKANEIPELTAITQKPIDQASDIVNQEKDQTNAAVTAQAYAHIVQLKNDMAYGENGFTNMKGQNAIGLTKTVMPAWGEAVEKITGGLTPLQRQSLLPAVKNETAEFNTLAATHEKEERMNFVKTSSDNLISNLQNDAITNYSQAPEKVDQSIDQQLSELKKQSKVMGWSQDELENQAHAAMNKTHDGVLERLLPTNYPEAQKYFDKYQEEITGPIKGDIITKLRQGAVAEKAVDIEKKVGSSYLMAGGQVNLNKIDADIYALPGAGQPGGFTDQEKQQIASNVKGQAYERIRGNEQAKQSANNVFLNYLAENKDKPLDGIQKDIAAMNADSATKAKWLGMANKMKGLGKSDVDDKATVNGLYTQILNGTGDPQKSLDEAWNGGNGKLSAKTYAALQNKVHDFVIHGPNGPAQQSWKDITNMATQHFGKADSADTNDFLYYVGTHANGKIDSDLKDFAAKELKSVPKTDFNVWSKVSEYNQNKGIQRHWWAPGNDTATQNAVKSLQKAGKPTTPEMIDFVLSKSKDGNY